MIDCENKVFDTVNTAVLQQFSKQYPGIVCYSEYQESPNSFPCVYLYEADNYVHASSITLTNIENYANVMYECTIYTNNSDGKKILGKSIAELIDKTMSEMGFVRTFQSQIPNLDRTIYRIVQRWTGVIAKGIEMDENIIFRVYGR